jgi:hypothetical protein
MSCSKTIAINTNCCPRPKRPATAFWGLADLTGFTVPVDAPANPGNPRPIFVPTLSLMNANKFQVITAEGFPVLQYIGGRQVLVELTTSSTFSKTGGSVKVRGFVAIGKNGALPTTTQNAIRDVTNVGDGQLGKLVANGTVWLDPCDTITLTFSNDQLIPGNTSTIENLKLVLTEV